VTGKYDTLIANGLLVDPRWGTPEDIGRVVASLARGDLPYGTGSVLHVDGGLTLQRL
jgi:3-oxoacyl-[acyl-carrier protein] reductase